MLLLHFVRVLCARDRGLLDCVQRSCAQVGDTVYVRGNKQIYADFVNAVGVDGSLGLAAEPRVGEMGGFSLQTWRTSPNYPASWLEHGKAGADNNGKRHRSIPPCTDQ